MEFRRYAKVLLQWWWLVASSLLVVAMASLVFSYVQPPMYRSSLTLVVSPKETLGEFSTVRQSLDTLDKPMIINTYSEVIGSRRIYEQASARLGGERAMDSPVDVIASATQNTNLIRIDVEGTDPEVVYAMANAVAEESIVYIDGLYELYDIKILDTARMPEQPFSPNILRNAALGAVLGLMLGVGLAFFGEYLKSPAEAAQASAIVDARTGLYSKRYFLQRLHEEMGRSQRRPEGGTGRHPLSVGMVSVLNVDGTEGLYAERARERLRRQVFAFLKRYLAAEQILASWDDDRLALLLPDANDDAARQAVERLRTRLEWTAFEDDESGAKVTYAGYFGLASYAEGLTERDLLSMAQDALREATTSGPEYPSNGNGNVRSARPVGA